MILLIDNYDSFVHNLARHFARLGVPTEVVRNDAIDAAGVRALCPEAVVISPGPGTPDEAGASIEIVQRLHHEVPILGVCLGHQAIAAALGGRVVRARQPMHGRTSLVEHDGSGLFAQLKSPLTVCRYHSLIVDPASLPSELAPTAWSDGEIMALAHRDLPVVGVQFHPEAILTHDGYQLLANFLDLAGLAITVDPQQLAHNELEQPQERVAKLPTEPVTF